MLNFDTNKLEILNLRWSRPRSDRLADLFNAERYFKFIIFFQGFYIYIYTVSIIFLIYAYVYLLQNKSLKLRRNLRRNQYGSPTSGSRSNLKRKYSFDESRTYHTGSFYLRLGAVGKFKN